jgi:hypothetical protein
MYARCKQVGHGYSVLPTTKRLSVNHLRADKKNADDHHNKKPGLTLDESLSPFCPPLPFG